MWNSLSRLAIGVILLTVSRGSPVLAQGPEQIQQFDTSRQREAGQSSLNFVPSDDVVPELYPDENRDVGPQSLLRFKPRRTHFEASSDTHYFYTGNMFLQETGAVDTGILVNTLQLALAPMPVDWWGGRLAPRLGYRQQWFNYGLEEAESKLNDFDFNVPVVFVDARWRWHERWVFEGGFEWVRLLSNSTQKEFYKDYTPRLAVTRLFPVSESAGFALGLESAYRFSDTDPRPSRPERNINDRTEHTFSAGFHHVSFNHLVLQPYYRLQYSHYTRSNGRNDLLHAFGLSSTWFFNSHCQVRAFVAYDLKESDDPMVSDYRKIDAGGGLALNLRF